jgi:MoaA/NifB/PqqE/SkfB family radical SAM enzyme
MLGYIRNKLVTSLNRFLISKKIYKLIFPSEIFLNVNSVCNAKCSMCSIGKKNKETEFYKLNMSKGNMEKRTFENLIKQIKNHGINISFKNTEPLIHPDIDYFLSLCKKNNVDCSLTTNGLLLEKHAESIVKNKVKGLQISINGYKEIHDNVVGIKRSYERSIQGIRLINKFKKKYKSMHPKIKIRMTVAPDNYQRLYRSVEELKKVKGINSVTITHLEFVDRFFEFNLERMNKELNKIRKEKYPFKIKIKPNFSFKELQKYYNTLNIMSKQNKCKCTYKSLAVFANGDVAQHVRCFNIFFGNINKTNIFKIWNNKKFKSFRKDLWEKKLPEFCRRCCGVL